jgi:outer membrane protein OmpA-like peptidoglycan-associated protein
MFRLLLVTFILSTQFVLSQVHQTSFYYVNGTTELTNYSSKKLSEFKAITDSFHVQIIELNAFSHIPGANTKRHDSIANRYAKQLLSVIPDQIPEATITVYGAQRIPIDFEPIHWNRVDLYYYQGDPKVLNKQIRYDDELPETDNQADSTLDYSTKEISVAPDLAIQTPIVTPIKFIPGKAKIRPSSYGYLDYLYNTLLENEDLHALIRGHVCCGHNFKISNKRAKAVYKELVKRGIDKKRLEYKGMSNTSPLIYPETTAADRNANRRVDIIFSFEEKL